MYLRSGEYVHNKFTTYDETFICVYITNYLHFFTMFLSFMVLKT
jgi:hypothetical protein